MFNVADLRVLDNKIKRAIVRADCVKDLLSSTKFARGFRAAWNIDVLWQIMNDLDQTLLQDGWSGYGADMEGKRVEIESSMERIKNTIERNNLNGAYVTFQREVKPILEYWQEVIEKYIKGIDGAQRVNQKKQKV